VLACAPEKVELALPLFRLSDYLTDILVRFPEELATLAKLAGATDREEGAPGSRPRCSGANLGGPEPSPALAFENIASADATYSEKLALLRKQFRTSVFASGARDILEARCVYHSLDETSSIADAAIAAALQIAGAPAGFAVLALGRLGTCEHDLLSDADLLFVRDEQTDSVEALRAASRVMEILSAYTREGTLFPVDARLRPHGGEGELVVTPAKLQDYFAREAQSWEALTFTKVRYVAGNAELGQQALDSTGCLFRRFADDPDFSASAREMRQKLEKTDTEVDNLKAGPGGLYDIDFIIGLLLVRQRGGTLGRNLRERLLLLRDACALDAADWKRLDRHAELLRTAEHVFRLVSGRSRKTLPVAGPAHAACEELCSRILHREFPEGLDITLRFALVGVREIYNRLLTD
jgi:glutamate-ammonia-ligase adenylyltransferase